MHSTKHSTKHRTNNINKIALFLAIAFVLTALTYIPIISTETIAGPFVLALMWTPGVAALLTQWISTRSLRGLGWRWGKSRYQLISLLLPLFVCLVVYGFFWGVGLVPFTTTRMDGMIELVEQVTGQRLPLLLSLLIAQVLLSPVSLFAVLGEEIGWRGLLMPELAKRFSFTKTALMTGIIWAIYHYPAIIFADYNSAAPIWYGLTMFTLTAFAASFILTWLRLKSGSLWTAVLLHTSHNMLVQSIFDPMTLDNGLTPYLATEFGVGLTIGYSLLAFYFWRRRGEVETTVVEGRADMDVVPSKLLVHPN